MATIDKINEALSEMQQELSTLQHYTKEIGKAEMAATEVVKFSKEYIISFQKRVTDIGKIMDEASSDFKKNCNEASVDLDSSKANFQKGINEAKNSLSEVVAELSNVALKVNNLAQKIDNIDILGHFNKMNEDIKKLNDEQTRNYTGLKHEMSDSLMKLQKVSNKNTILSYITNVLLVTTVSLLVYMIL